VTRFTILSQKFHDLNPDFFSTYLGFRNFKEAKIHIEVHFQVSPHELFYDAKYKCLPKMSDFECIVVLTKLFMESF
jgi:hypothetical protein